MNKHSILHFAAAKCSNLTNRRKCNLFYPITDRIADIRLTEKIFYPISTIYGTLRDTLGAVFDFFVLLLSKRLR